MILLHPDHCLINAFGSSSVTEAHRLISKAWEFIEARTKGEIPASISWNQFAGAGAEDLVHFNARDVGSQRGQVNLIIEALKWLTVSGQGGGQVLACNPTQSTGIDLWVRSGGTDLVFEATDKASYKAFACRKLTGGKGKGKTKLCHHEAELLQMREEILRDRPYQIVRMFHVLRASVASMAIKKCGRLVPGSNVVVEFLPQETTAIHLSER